MAGFLVALACEASPPKETPRPPAPSALPVAPDACASGGGTVDDAVRAAYFPRRVSGLCIDRHADVRSYGKGAKAPLGSACEVLPGECASYGPFGLARVFVVPYLASARPRARVTVTLLELASPEASYALLTRRILGDAPDDFRAWKAIDPEGTQVLSGARALVWRANHLAFIDYTDETTTPAGAAERGAPMLEGLSRELARLLPGKPDRPASVTLLPERDAGPLAVRFDHEDVFGIGGLGSGATARYAVGGRNAPMAILARPDDDAAKDVLRTLRRIPGSRSPRGGAYESVEVSIQSGGGAPRMEWFFGRRRNVVLGTGREPEKLDRAGRARVRHREALRLKELLDAID
jgi:hypothetical protein